MHNRPVGLEFDIELETDREILCEAKKDVEYYSAAKALHFDFAEKVLVDCFKDSFMKQAVLNVAQHPEKAEDIDTHLLVGLNYQSVETEAIKLEHGPQERFPTEIYPRTDKFINATALQLQLASNQGNVYGPNFKLPAPIKLEERPERVLVFSGICGALSALEKLIEKVKPTKNDHIVFLGGYLNWSAENENGDVLGYLLHQFKINFPQTVFLRGNRENTLLDLFYLEYLFQKNKGLITPITTPDLQCLKELSGVIFQGGLNHLEDYERNFMAYMGGADIFRVYSKNGGYECIPPEHLAFLLSMPFFHRLCIPVQGTDRWYFLSHARPDLSKKLDQFRVDDFLSGLPYSQITLGLNAEKKPVYECIPLQKRFKSYKKEYAFTDVGPNGQFPIFVYTHRCAIDLHIPSEFNIPICSWKNPYHEPPVACCDVLSRKVWSEA